MPYPDIRPAFIAKPSPPWWCCAAPCWRTVYGAVMSTSSKYSRVQVLPYPFFKSTHEYRVLICCIHHTLKLWQSSDEYEFNVRFSKGLVSKVYRFFCNSHILSGARARRGAWLWTFKMWNQKQTDRDHMRQSDNRWIAYQLQTAFWKFVTPKLLSFDSTNTIWILIQVPNRHEADIQSNGGVIFLAAGSLWFYHLVNDSFMKQSQVTIRRAVSFPFLSGTDQRGRAHRGRVCEQRLLAGGALDLHEGESRGLVGSSARSQFGKVRVEKSGGAKKPKKYFKIVHFKSLIWR